MTGWQFLTFVVVAASSGTCGILFGAQWVRDDQAARDDELARDPVGWLPLHITPSKGDQRRADMARHPSGGRR